MIAHKPNQFVCQLKSQRQIFKLTVLSILSIIKKKKHFQFSMKKYILELLPSTLQYLDIFITYPPPLFLPFSFFTRAGAELSKKNLSLAPQTFFTSSHFLCAETSRLGRLLRLFPPCSFPPSLFSQF